jgi:hypothetical protein
MSAPAHVTDRNADSVEAGALNDNGREVAPSMILPCPLPAQISEQPATSSDAPNNAPYVHSPAILWWGINE